MKNSIPIKGKGGISPTANQSEIQANILKTCLQELREPLVSGTGRRAILAEADAQEVEAEKLCAPLAFVVLACQMGSYCGALLHIHQLRWKAEVRRRTTYAYCGLPIEALNSDDVSPN